MRTIKLTTEEGDGGRLFTIRIYVEATPPIGPRDLERLTLTEIAASIANMSGQLVDKLKGKLD